MNADNPIRILLIATAIMLIVAAAITALVFAVDIFLLIFLGILFAVLLAKTSQLVASKTPVSYGWSLSGVVTLLFASFLLSIAFFAVRIETQLERAGQKLDESVGVLREKLEDRDQLRSLLQSIPIAGELLKADSSEALIQNENSGTNSSQSSESGTDTSSTSGSGSDSKEVQPSGALTRQMSSVAGKAAGVLGRIFATTLGALTSIAVVVFVGLFIAVDPQLYKSGVVRLFPKQRRERVSQIMDELGDSLWRWLLGRFLSMLITGAGTGVVLWLLGVPLPVTLGIVTGLLTFIPNIGGFIALGIAVLLALPTGVTTAVWVIALYLVLQLIESNVITPLVQQQQVSVPPAMLISFQLLMGSLTGFLGVMVATPLLAATLVAVKRAYLEDVLGDEVKIG